MIYLDYQAIATKLRELSSTPRDCMLTCDYQGAPGIWCFLGLHDWLSGSVTLSVWPVETGEFFRECRRCGKRRLS